MSQGQADPSRQTMLFEIVNKLGLHARAAAMLVETASRFEAEVTVTKDGQAVNAKSIMELLLLAAACGSRIDVTAVGADAAAAVTAIGELIADRFGEGE